MLQDTAVLVKKNKENLDWPYRVQNNKTTATTVNIAAPNPRVHSSASVHSVISIPATNHPYSYLTINGYPSARPRHSRTLHGH